MVLTGFDFLTVDAEHSAADIYQTKILLQTIKAGNQHCVPLVRLPSFEYVEIQHYMAAGAAGVIAPLVTTAKQSEKVVSAVKYPPNGT